MDYSWTDTFVSQYLNHCRYEKGLDAKTLKAYRIDLDQFNQYVKNSDMTYDKECLQSYIVTLHNKYAVKSTKRKIASLKAFFNYLEYEELIKINPFTKLRVKLHEPFVLPRTIPFDIIFLLLQGAYHQSILSENKESQRRAALRNVAVLELLFASGMRISELCGLRNDDVDLLDKTIKINGKGSKERLIQIGNPSVLDALNAYRQAFAGKIEETGWFFINRLGHRLSAQSVRAMINTYCSLIGIKMHITPHMFRHSFATLLLEEGVDIRYIQQLLGHSSIMTTQIYTHVTSKKQRDILTTKHPRNKMNVM